ncbi:hypothetical protein O9993_22795 [Vibrio lentus]|nr:hypothetical protein [Vibrio lentus]
MRFYQSTWRLLIYPLQVWWISIGLVDGSYRVLDYRNVLMVKFAKNVPSRTGKRVAIIMSNQIKIQPQVRKSAPRQLDKTIDSY